MSPVLTDLPELYPKSLIIIKQLIMDLILVQLTLWFLFFRRLKKRHSTKESDQTELPEQQQDIVDEHLTEEGKSMRVFMLYNTY